ncbi:MAG: MBL fold metallo-hydrolase [Sphingobacteriales bacterium]|nr:MAG: MBL fold metallo-hydrolase [Sphingobacteriales bacterium]
MLTVQSFTFNPFQENTYVISNNQKQCWIVDPGMFDDREKAQLFEYIASKQLVPQAIINTHTHIDHIFGVQAVVDKYNIPFGIHEKDLPLLNVAPTSAAMFGCDFRLVPQPTFYISETTPLMLGEDEVDIRFVPGHSQGSIAFYYAPGNWAIVGDVLFQGSIGRTDLPGGHFDTLINSIRTQLFPLPDETVVYSGHGPATTIGQEKKYNPFLQ